MSPEQCEGKKLDPRSDVYSMGVLMYEALTGELPHMGKTMMETMTKHLSEKAERFATIRPDLYIPERLENVIFHCLEKKPADRPQSMAALREELLYSIPQTRPTTDIPVFISDTAKSTNSINKRLGKGRFIVAYLLLSLAIGFLCLSISRWQQMKPVVVEKPAVVMQVPIAKSDQVKVKATIQEDKPIPAAAKPVSIIVRPKPKAIKQDKVITKPKSANPWDSLELESSGRKYGQNF
jgi:serine/threonine protein kinase